MKEKIENGRLTLNQVKYLTLLDKLEQKRGAVQNIADQCGVRHPTVSRFFKACVEKGYLTESYAFTEKGRRILVGILPISTVTVSVSFWPLALV